MNKIIYPEYATACRRFTNPEYVRKSVFTGERRIVQSYRQRTVEGDKWITFAIIAGEDCNLENPTVLFTWREADSDTITLLDTLPTIFSLYDKLIRINLSNNTYEPVLVDDDEQERLSGGVINMYEWWAGCSKDGKLAVDKVRHELLRDNYEISVGIETGACGENVKNIDRFIQREFHDCFDDILDYDKLDQMLRETETMQFNYQKTDGICMNIRILRSTGNRILNPKRFGFSLKKTTNKLNNHS